jgi:hypothetical protein
MTVEASIDPSYTNQSFSIALVNVGVAFTITQGTHNNYNSHNSLSPSIALVCIVRFGPN